MKPLAIGIDDFRELVEKGYYYVDKTLFIKDILDNGGKANLFTRPRRFGKTLALSTLKYFFEKEECQSSGSAKQHLICDKYTLFEGLKIMETGEKYLGHMGKYPVISLSLKSAKQPDFKMAHASLVDEIAKEYERHRYILQSGDITESNKDRFLAIMNRKAEPIDYAKALAFLSSLLEIHHHEKVILLLDEYDVPLENAYFAGFYKEMSDFIRSLFESALKSNPSLSFAAITGCLRISKESIFTGLNNLDINSILNNRYAAYFGFTKPEVEKLLADYGLEDKRETAREWYDGYLFGETETYNPWSIINYVKSIDSSTTGFPKPYWANTSSNQIVRKLVEKADIQTKLEIEVLIAGGTIEKPVHEEITYEDVYRTPDNLWNFLYFTGYLKKISERLDGVTYYVSLGIPNMEVRYIYENTIQNWFLERVKKDDLSSIYQAMFAGDAQRFQNELSRLLRSTISYMDSQEAFYHGFLLGTLCNLTDCLVKSNREAGEGRYDILIRSLDITKPPVVIELKVSNTFKNMERNCQIALEQIEDKKYDSWLPEEGYQESIRYGIAFYKKQCLIAVERVSF